ncbi:DUF3095 family protein [Roseibium salinum]|uniref:DUF3095 family protein n=1 Tax=Roseibium salinum TaxID=1604349 RepID=A0ABT3R3C6_9HYPH|nr:DUF3095 family protein [Roseibium sp. DSM 29163]MCX2723720.1 DUF3095 family protein [Roseibium sp. DSM 29163]
MSADDFYSELPSFSDFSTVGALDDYRPVPGDWYVLAADIVRSSDAIAAGRYKEVNMVGAAVIAAVLNRLGRDRVPFVFGGDGAMLVVPAHDVDAGRDALAGVVDLARQVMELELRAAAIPVAHLRKLGGDVRLRKYRLSPGNHLAMIVGDGLALADRILKDPEASKPFAVPVEDVALPPLDGLSCRWEPLAAQNGHIVSLIIKPTGRRPMSDIMSEVAGKLGFNPLTDDRRARLAEKSRLRFQFPPKGLKLEVLTAFADNRLRGWVRTLLECVVFVMAYTTGKRIGPLDPKKYFEEMSLNTDHRKVGDSLQLVLDLTLEQLAGVEDCLMTAYEAGDVIYGLHVSHSALMTCFVQDIGNSRHIHFVDGADGGLSVAASQFKERQSALQKA